MEEISEAPSYAEGFEPEAFTYDPEADVYLCPQGKILAYSCYNKNGHKKRYLAARKECNNCPCRQQCVGSSKSSRMVERLLHEEARQEQAKNRNILSNTVKLKNKIFAICFGINCLMCWTIRKRISHLDRPFDGSEGENDLFC